MNVLRLNDVMIAELTENQTESLVRWVNENTDAMLDMNRIPKLVAIPKRTPMPQKKRKR